MDDFNKRNIYLDIIYRDEQQIILETTPPPRSGDQFLVIIVNFLKRHL